MDEETFKDIFAQFFPMGGELNVKNNIFIIISNPENVILKS